jgi:thioredoxin reductase (NADPH)
VIDAGDSRAALIPLTRNLAGFPEGISGSDLLVRMRDQAARYGATLREGVVETIEQADGVFVARIGEAAVRARSILLATGVANRRPPMIDEATHAQALARGKLRYCPICDGYEVTDRRVAVIGSGQRACDEALFLRSYTADIMLILNDCDGELSVSQRTALRDAGIRVASGCRSIGLAGDELVIELGDGLLPFDALYPALGSDIRSELAGQLGANRSEDGCVTVDAHQRTSVAGLYAAGDIVQGLDQISHAMGEGGVAATTIRNDLARQTPLRR